MSSLGDLLELLYTARQRFTGFHAAGRYWHDIAGLTEAYGRWAARRPPGSVQPLGAAGGGAVPPRPAIYEQRSRLWMRQPSRWRAEVDLPSEGVTRLQVTDGPRWWLYDPRRGVETNAAAARPESSPRPIEAATADAFDPAPVIPTLWLEPRGPTRQAGRSTIRVRGVPREGAGDPVRWPGADEYELLVDADRGVLLRFAASLEGEEFAAIELERVVFDEELPDTLFAFALPVDAGGQRR